ncbi:MAG: hypothetical protein CYPHOPRED_005451 [Cyphobasidiales sp. Tagirdzhanova-0007]|nr:MAG: hypothetical protein CYPHOPRED_005451 [Cyphobasidiales sp. Tagirdzhanova-0007]
MASLTQPTQRRGKSVHQVNGVGQAEVVDVDDPYGPLRDGERAIAYRDKDEIAMGTGVGLYGLPTTKALLDEDASTSSLSSHFELFVYAFIALLGGIVRFYKIWHPDGVVFDEVHFGKFASYYIRREYFFDVHPPLAKLLFAFAGWAIGYDGHFEFENIGDDYNKNDVPYVGLRAFPAILGSLTPPVVYGIMRESGYPRLIAILSAMLILFDNAHVTQTRLILLDAPMILFQACAIYAYIRFYKLRYLEFTQAWWTWLVTTGIFLAFTISCKMVGLFMFLTVGSAVCIDLWNILDVRRGLSMKRVSQHFFARVLGLIIVPAIVYLFWFWVHFRVLSHSGTGDDFMSSSFQETLVGSPLTVDAEEIRYYDTVTLRHRLTKVFLHSHLDKYPLQYDDGRISSAGQQVTGYPFNDTNNHWVVEPTKEIPEHGRGRVVRHNDVIRLLHLNTQSYLLTHDVACPLMATNEEFTTWPKDDKARENETTFRMEIEEAHAGQQWMTKSGHFKLIHESTKVAMWTRATPVLPEWGFKQQEVNGHKNLYDPTNYWFADEIMKNETVPDVVRQAPQQPKKIRKLNFFRKFFELQILMIQHNAGLTDSHPYASGPINWPFLLSGISFWTGNNTDREQIYMIGNFVDWWLCILALSVFVGVLGAEQIARRRGIQAIPDHVIGRLYNTGGFFLLGWFFHYAPFWTMNRQLFLHHYLPAHLMSALVAGVAFNFIFSETVNYPISIPGPTTRRRPRMKAEVPKKMVTGVIFTVAAIVAGFVFTSPLTYEIVLH